MMAGNFGGGFPIQGFPPPQMPQLMPQGTQGRQPAAALAPNTLAPQQVPPRPIIRAQREDDPVVKASATRAVSRSRFVSLPSPEELGVGQSPAQAGQAIDWTAVHKRLDLLGATCFHLERLSAGTCRITCLLPTSQTGRAHRIEAEAATEADAVRAALAKAEEVAAAR